MKTIYQKLNDLKTKSTSKSITSLLTSIILLSMLFSSCKKEEEVTKSYAKVLVTHASPNAPGVDLLVDNSKQNSAALSYPANTGYLQVEAGTRNIKVNVSGTSTFKVILQGSIDGVNFTNMHQVAGTTGVNCDTLQVTSLAPSTWIFNANQTKASSNTGRVKVIRLAFVGTGTQKTYIYNVQVFPQY